MEAAEPGTDLSSTLAHRQRGLSERRRSSAAASAPRSWPAPASTGRGARTSCAPAEALGAPVFLNRMGRGCLPADHDLAFSRARLRAQGGGRRPGDRPAAGLPPRLRRLPARGRRLVWARRRRMVDRNRKPEVELVGGNASPRSAAASGADPARTGPWPDTIRATEDEARAERAELDDERARSIRCGSTRAAESRSRRDRDRRRGDFVSTPARSSRRRCRRMEHRRCLGAGQPGDRRETRAPGPPVCLLLGDGAFGLGPRVRHDGASRDPDRRRDQARDLGARAPPDEVPLRLLRGGGAAAGERYDWSPRRWAATPSWSPSCMSRASALERAFASGKPALVNVLTDPEVVYPRKSTWPDD